MPLSRCFAVIIIGSILVLALVISLTNCAPEPLSTKMPEALDIHNISTPLPFAPQTTTISPSAPQTTTMWILVDRSESMKKCTDREILYQLPGFLAHIASAVSDTSDFYISELFFPKPEIGVIYPTLASKIWETMRRQHISITAEITRNQYGEAMEKVPFLTRGEQRRVVVLLTDGTFSKGGDKEAERREIERGLHNLAEWGKAEVYVILCHQDTEEAQEARELWNKFKSERKLTELYELNSLTNLIENLGNKLFREWIDYKKGKRGWLTPTTIITLPGETITYNLTIITRDPEENVRIDSNINVHQLRCHMGFCTVPDRLLPGTKCKPQEIQIKLGTENSIGFYSLEVYSTPPIEIQTANSVNHQTAPLTVSLKELLVFHPSHFAQCYSEVELTSRIVNTSAQFQDVRVTLIWQPPQIEPGDYSGWIYIKNLEGKVIFTDSVTLSVRFHPIPIDKSVIRMNSRKMVDDKGNQLYKLVFRFNYVPLKEQPQIFLCSSLSSTETAKINRDLACGQAICCSDGPYKSNCSIICPTPIPCLPEVSDYCTNCTPVMFGDLCATASAVMSSPNNGLPQFSQTYTVTLYECLTKSCGYTGLLFFWPGGREAVTTSYYYKRVGETWILTNP